MQRDHQPKLELSLFEHEDEKVIYTAPKKTVGLDPMKHVLIGMVKEDNEEYFLDGVPTKIYYTGKTKNFPSTIALNKLYYFMPYIKGKGVKDLYLINIARIGTKAEVHPSSKDKEPRLVFDLELIHQFKDYKPIQPNIFHTYRDTTLLAVEDK